MNNSGDETLKQSWDAVKQTLETFISLGERLTAKGDPYAAGRAEGIDEMAVGTALSYSRDPALTREAYRRSLARAMRNREKLTLVAVTKELARLTFGGP